MCDKTVNASSISQSIPQIPAEEVVQEQVSQMGENKLKSMKIQHFAKCVDMNCL